MASILEVVLVALRQARPRGADGMDRLGRPLRRATRRYSSQRDEFHLMGMAQRDEFYHMGMAQRDEFHLVELARPASLRCA